MRLLQRNIILILSRQSNLIHVQTHLFDGFSLQNTRINRLFGILTCVRGVIIHVTSLINV